MGKGDPGKMGLKDYPKRGEIYLVTLDPTVGKINQEKIEAVEEATKIHLKM